MSKILVINDLMSTTNPSAESLIHWEFPDEDEPCGRLSLDAGGFFSQQTDARVTHF
jgi:hypothetical protein